MASSTTNSAYWQGVRDGAPFVLVVAPFALLFGVVATEAGLNLLETMAFSVLVIAGASQFTALQLLTENAPTVIVLASALAVNLRMAMYSASLVPHLGAAPLWQRAFAAYFLVDQSYAMGIVKYERDRDMSLREKMAYFFGVVTPICPNWYLFTLIGALVGQKIPPEMALDFAVPITFIALTAPMLRTGAHVAAALMSVTLALVLAGLPYNSGLLVAGIGGMITGAQAELWMERRGMKV
ncbi:4-azaleucine resistance probable transporter AzlC [Salinihabitans flavidus]|uniref:4-azaleucine resistance probable transporter AzlC n=1 Tax=Salinihabitans flavidus TaxID=569882 RepID=A0A1H8SX23_9RHOB|nr:AzlC family ABC transporter permease [Salinihabitans flavidus]SEO83212.1 4-azaleucine resistance probable transporter AzlC [Salinihabitans flavidus]